VEDSENVREVGTRSSGIEYGMRGGEGRCACTSLCGV
jgi:hypothetical protein